MRKKMAVLFNLNLYLQFNLQEIEKNFVELTNWEQKSENVKDMDDYNKVKKDLDNKKKKYINI